MQSAPYDRAKSAFPFFSYAENVLDIPHVNMNAVTLPPKKNARIGTVCITTYIRTYVTTAKNIVMMGCPIPMIKGHFIQANSFNLKCTNIGKKYMTMIKYKINCAITP